MLRLLHSIRELIKIYILLRILFKTVEKTKLSEFIIVNIVIISGLLFMTILFKMPFWFLSFIIYYGKLEWTIFRIAFKNVLVVVPTSKC